MIRPGYDCGRTGKRGGPWWSRELIEPVNEPGRSEKELIEHFEFKEGVEVRTVLAALHAVPVTNSNEVP